MLEELSERLSKKLEQKRLKEKLEQDLLAVEEELRDQSARFESLSTQLVKEKVDVEKLERMSLTTLFHSVLGSREEQLDKERQELLSAQLLYQQAKKQVFFLEQEQNTLLQRLDELADVESEYESLLSEKEQLLRQSNQVVASELIEYAEQSANLDSEIKEVGEAIAAGNNTIGELDQVIEALKSAENWGTWDMLGGGFLSTAAKHSQIDNARKGIDNVQRRMSQFKRELADVRKQIELQIDIGEFEYFADYFIDGLIFDWVVQSKITDSLSRSKGAKSTIVQAVKELEELKKIAQKRQHDLKEKRAQIIENT
jgi:hypothetical protein